jgi:DNA-binding HxlR family transcriptional regulator
MPSNTVPSPRSCPIARSLDLLGDRWTLLVLREAFYGTRRFEGFVAMTGAPRDVLANRMARLVGSGLLRKEAYNPGGTRFEYHLTRKGLATRPILVALGEFGETELPDANAPWRQLATTLDEDAH